MSITFVCPSCAARLRAQDNKAGRKIKCPKCGSAAVVPSVVGEKDVAELVDDAAELPVVRQKAAPAPVQEEDSADLAPRSLRQPSRAVASSSTMTRTRWLIVAGVGAGGLILAVGVVLFIMMRKPMRVTIEMGSLASAETEVHSAFHRQLQEMAAAVKSQDTERMFQHISSEFRHKDLDRAAFRQYIEKVFRNHEVNELRISEEKFPSTASKSTCWGSFRAYARGPTSNEFYRVEAIFVRDLDGQWRLKGFDFFNPFVMTNEPLQLPKLP